MKIRLSLFILIGTVVALVSCNNDFLKNEEGQLYVSDSPLVISPKYPTSSIALNLPEAGNENYVVINHPKWLQLDPLRGTFRDGRAAILYTVSEPEYQTTEGYYSANLIIKIDHVGYFYIEVLYGDFETGDGQATDPGSGDGQNVNEGDYTEIAGTVVDAAYDKGSDKLVVATKNPNQLLMWETGSWTSSVIQLEQTPKCMEISDDGKLFVGFTIARLSEFDLAQHELLRTFDLDFVPFDLAAGNNGWLYLAPSGMNQQSLRCLNLETGEMVSQGNDNFLFYANTLLQKIEGKPVLAATRTEVSPNGLLLFDISKGIPNDTIDYWHASFDHLWPFGNGERFIGGYNHEVYFMPGYQPTNDFQFELNIYGEMEFARFYNYDMDECDAIHSIFVAEGNSYYESDYQQESGIIEQFDAVNLNLQNTYQPSMKVIDQNGSTVVAYHQVRYVFANSSGTKLYAVRRIAPDFGINQWSIERFDIN